MSSSSTSRPREGWRRFMRHLLLLLDGMLVGMVTALHAERDRLRRGDPRRAELRASIERLMEGRAWIAELLSREDGVDDLDLVLLTPLLGVWNYSVGRGWRRLFGRWLVGCRVRLGLLVDNRCTTITAGSVLTAREAAMTAVRSAAA